MRKSILFVALLILGGIMFKHLPKMGYVRYDSQETAELQIIVEELKSGAGRKNKPLLQVLPYSPGKFFICSGGKCFLKIYVLNFSVSDHSS